jgi:CubicO group peptidase (beta-lactamase class C family)
VDAASGSLQERLEAELWPLVAGIAGWREVVGLAVAVLRDDDVDTRCFGVRDVRTGAPVTDDTLFHLASVSKPFVATAIATLASGRGGVASIDLDAPVTEWVPELALADGRESEVTARHLMSHTSGLPDVSDYGWHDPQLGDDALSDLARSMSSWRLLSEPGSTYAYSNAGYDLLGLLLSRVTGTTFEEAVRRQVLAPLHMRRSTFLRSAVPLDLAASPHIGMPPVVPGGAYPYSRRHAPSSTLHSSLAEMVLWAADHLDPTGKGEGHPPRGIDDDVRALVQHEQIAVGSPPWEEGATLGWARGTWRGHPTFGHSGADPGFGARIVLVPGRRTGVVVLANSNTVPATAVAAAALDIALATSDAGDEDGIAALRRLLPLGIAPVADVLAAEGPSAAADELTRIGTLDPPAFDLDEDELFGDGVWGAIELHRTDLAWPQLRLWTGVRPDSSAAWGMTGWAHQVDGDTDEAVRALTRALELDPGNDDASRILASLRPA